MQEQLISFETAKLAKEKGLLDSFESCLNKTEYVSAFYSEYGVSFEETEFQLQDCAIQDRYYRPTQSFLKKWLREEHNIFIDVVFFYNEEDLPLTKTNRPKPKGYFVWNYYDEYFSEDKTEKFNNYEDALEVGLINGLKLI